MFTSQSHSSTPAIILLLERPRNVWPMWNAAQPGTSFILALRNVCWVNFQHQSWVVRGWGGFLPFAAVLLLAVADEPSEIRATNSLRE